MDKMSNSELELAISFSEMMKLDLDEGASILASYDWDIERAIGSIDLNAQAHRPIGESLPNPQGEKKRQKNQGSSPMKKPARQPQSQSKKQKQASRSIINEQAHLQRQNPYSLSEVYLAGQNRKQMPKMEAIASQFFISYITNMYHPSINFSFGGFSSTLSRSYRERKYVLLYVHYFDDKIQKQYEKVIKQIMTNKDITRFVNNYCIAYGVIHQSPEYAQIAEYVSKQRNVPTFAILKFDHIRQKQEFLSSYSLNTQHLNFLEWLSMAIDINASGEVLHRVGQRLDDIKSNIEPQDQQDIIDDQLIEEQLVDDSQLYDGRYEDRPVVPRKEESKFKEERSKIEKSQIDYESVIKRKEDNHLMQQQDAVYKKMERSYLAKKQVSELKHEQSKIRAKEREVKEKQWNIRKKKMEGGFQVPEDDEGISVKFRLPDSVSVVHKFRPKDKAQKLFHYVDIFCRDHFEQNFNDFKLTLNFSESQLEDLKKQELETVFQGEKAVTVIVKQI